MHDMSSCFRHFTTSETSLSSCPSQQPLVESFSRNTPPSHTSFSEGFGRSPLDARDLEREKNSARKFFQEQDRRMMLASLEAGLVLRQLEIEARQRAGDSR